MSQAAFDALKPTLDALPKVKAPDMPVHVALAEAAALLAFLFDHHREGSKRPGAAAQAALAAVGFTSAHVAAFADAAAALSFIQAVHVSAGKRTTDEEHQQAIADAYTLRANVIAACRWNMRRDRVAQGALNQIAEGEGTPDLISDLLALAVLIQSKPDAFRDDATFDPDQRAEACRQAAATVQALTSGSALIENKRDAIDARDRAWTHFRSLRKDLRAAAQYAFLNDPKTLAKFFSPYTQQRNKRAKAATSSAPKSAAPSQP